MLLCTKELARMFTTHSLTHSPTHSPTHSLTHPPTHSPTHSLTHSLTHTTGTATNALKLSCHRHTGQMVALKEIRLNSEEGTPFTAIREGMCACV